MFIIIAGDVKASQIPIKIVLLISAALSTGNRPHELPWKDWKKENRSASANSSEDIWTNRRIELSWDDLSPVHCPARDGLVIGFVVRTRITH